MTDNRNRMRFWIKIFNIYVNGFAFILFFIFSFKMKCDILCMKCQLKSACPCYACPLSHIVSAYRIGIVVIIWLGHILFDTKYFSYFSKLSHTHKLHSIQTISYILNWLQFVCFIFLHFASRFFFVRTFSVRQENKNK